MTRPNAPRTDVAGVAPRNEADQLRADHQTMGGMPADLMTLGFEIRRHLEDYVLGAMLVGEAEDRTAAYKVLDANDFTGPFRRGLYLSMKELDESGVNWLLVDAYERACVRSGVAVHIADVLQLEENVATAALIPGYAIRLRDLSLEREAALLHDRALREGDDDGHVVARLSQIARKRAELREGRS